MLTDLPTLVKLLAAAGLAYWWYSSRNPTDTPVAPDLPDPVVNRWPLVQTAYNQLVAMYYGIFKGNQAGRDAVKQAIAELARELEPPND